MQEIASSVMCGELVRAANDPSIKAVVIRLDSPGKLPTNGHACLGRCLASVCDYGRLTCYYGQALISVVLTFIAVREHPEESGHLSAGGSAVASDTIYREVLRLKERGKPVIVSMGNVAASGGYYISAPATKIVAQPSTVTGSIGVVSSFVMMP